ncbi:DUF4760 domain-containing protein [Halomonas salifodinae]|uniref:DUF4760 domain-containing protein n=1 Tax=Halomonas salifodinae TaxID=438745 RepID=UPI0033ABB2A8
MLDTLHSILELIYLSVYHLISLLKTGILYITHTVPGFFDHVKKETVRVWMEHPTAYVTGFTGILAAIVAGFTIRKQRFLSREKNSLDFQVTYKHNAEVNDCWRKIRAIARDELEQVILGQNSQSKTETAQALSTICNEWERCANAIKKDVYDEEFLYRVYASTVIGIYSDYGIYINERRKQNPKFFNNFIWLAERWARRRSAELEKRDHEGEKLMAMIEHGKIMTHIDRINKITERIKESKKQKNQ